MTNRLLKYLAAGALGTMLALASPALAFHGGGGMGGGGMHMGGMGGGMHFGGMGGPHFGAGFAGPRAGFGAVGPGFASGFGPRFNHFAFHNSRFFFHHHHRFAFIGTPFLFAGGFDSCWRRVWTSFGPRWVNVCGDYWGW